MNNIDKVIRFIKRNRNLKSVTELLGLRLVVENQQQNILGDWQCC